MSLPLKVVDRIFERLMATYGRDLMSRYEGLELVAVKTVWGHELSGFAGRLPDLAWALEHLPERCPNVIEFRNLCRQAPAPQTPRLPEPKADPERLKTELEKLSELRQTVAREPGSGKDWARRILTRHANGERIRPISLRFAREALKLEQ